VILLTLLAKRFPFFNSADDIDATIEMASIFGSRRMKQAAALHGLVWECSLATIGNSGYPLDSLIHWSCCRSAGEKQPRGEPQAIRFMAKCMEVLPGERLSAKQALQHEFLQNFDESDGDEEDAAQSGEEGFEPEGMDGELEDEEETEELDEGSVGEEDEMEML